jgi:MFS-type transporter involved in bile tolerance (Atg22 family)
MWIKVQVRRGTAILVGERQLRTASMIEYAILIVMVIFAIGFGWLWFIEQKKKRKRKEALQQKEIER